MCAAEDLYCIIGDTETMQYLRTFIQLRTNAGVFAEFLHCKKLSVCSSA